MSDSAVSVVENLLDLMFMSFVLKKCVGIDKQDKTLKLNGF
ncbi:hypothetical protein KUL113_13360 [Tenacibaculum sp. KUL113]|nr:hypothetical protein KUL113_13360 [Tenacibaculum sp. KUL113]